MVCAVDLGTLPPSLPWMSCSDSNYSATLTLPPFGYAKSDGNDRPSRAGHIGRSAKPLIIESHDGRLWAGDATRRHCEVLG